MLNSDLRKIPLLVTTIGYQTICCRTINKTTKECINIIPITEEEENRLDNGFLKTKKGDQNFIIYTENIICYGDIDFNTNSDDYKTIENMKWLDYLVGVGLCVPANYDYSKHCCYSDNRKPKYYDTTNPAIISQYKHAVLGKPERCCIFKQNITHGNR